MATTASSGNILEDKKEMMLITNNRANRNDIICFERYGQMDGMRTIRGSPTSLGWS
jgi:hypothetical protein